MSAELLFQDDADAAADYERCVDHERDAWGALQAHAPGSTARRQAWSVWSEAIARTNRAWRRLSATRAGRDQGAQRPHA